MNVLLAGGAGYIGSHTAVELLNAGHQVVIVDRSCWRPAHRLCHRGRGAAAGEPPAGDAAPLLRRPERGRVCLLYTSRCV